MKEVKTENAPAAIGPYSQGVICGGLVFASGQIPVDPQTGAVAQGIEAQAHRALTNLRAVLEAAGTGMTQVIKTTVFLQSMEDFATVNRIYEAYFTRPYPARSCVEVAKLPKGVSIEIEAIARLPEPRP